MIKNILEKTITWYVKSISCQMVFIIVKKFILKKSQKFCSNTEIDEIQNKILTWIISNTANKVDW